MKLTFLFCDLVIGAVCLTLWVLGKECWGGGGCTVAPALLRLWDLESEVVRMKATSGWEAYLF